MKHLRNIMKGKTLWMLMGLTLAYQVAYAAPKNGKTYAMSTKDCYQLITQQLGPVDQTYDLRFLTLMIDHHQAALTLAKGASTKAQHPQIRNAAREIVIDETREVNKLIQWRKQFFNR